MTSPRVFLYARVSTGDQHTANQTREVEAAGFLIERRRVFEEVISGSVAATQRPKFSALIQKLDEGDVLVVTKLDRLGRNAMDVRSTVELLAVMGVKVYCLALGGMDLTSTAGKMTMGVIAAVAEFERDLLIDRTRSGQALAKAKGVKFGRPFALSATEAERGANMLCNGKSISEIARQLGTSRRTVYRLAARLDGSS